MKKNVLAVALVAGLGLAGAAAAYNYGTAAFGTASTTGDTSTTSPSGILTPENVAYQMLYAPTYSYTMTEDLVFDIQIPDNAVQITTGFTVRVKLNRNGCVPVSLPPGSPVPAVDAVCADTTDGALFNTANIPTPGTGAGQLELNSALVTAGWTVQFDGYYDGGRTASIRIIPTPGGSTANPGPGEMLRWHNAQLTSLNEFAAGATAGGTDKVDAEFWMVNASNDTRFTGSTQSRTILQRTTGVTACANSSGSEVDKYIDVADNWNEDQLPKSRFSEDGKLGTAADAQGGSWQSPADYGSQVIDLGDVTITNNGAGSFAFLGSDQFTTVVTGSNGDDWNAFENGTNIDDEVYLVNGTCASGTLVDQGAITPGPGGNSVTFNYSATAAGLPLTTGASTTSLTVCAFANKDQPIDDHPNHVSTTFVRGSAIPTPVFGDVHLGNGTSTCDLLPLRYNGSTMEIFTINPGSNVTQRSFIRLTNRSTTGGYVSLQGYDNAGNEGASQVRVWVDPSASVQLDAADLENGTNGAIGAWGTGIGKWRAVVTAEFPGLVASSLVNSSLPNVLSNITDSDTRGEQYDRDYNEGTFASEIGERPSDFNQEFSPDYRGNGTHQTAPGGPNGGTPSEGGPAGGWTVPNGNPGLDP